MFTNKSHITIMFSACTFDLVNFSLLSYSERTRLDLIASGTTIVGYFHTSFFNMSSAFNLEIELIGLSMTGHL